ncbi:outer membrane beta-barrel protein [Hyphomicrobium sp.]|uniref:outer membrane protein n=1 Tax=Hyphomicrobium sp. TaxID=82 RepID=UPI001D9A72A5|nr:outer membrane beta-barrel protein [Hyphomicrobium sp.]MBY0561432.1 outer membrane beta-barrel protein [Hyphomicrobium sp.]
MRALLIAAAIVMAASSTAMSQEYHWTGLYGGASVGYGWGDATVTDNAKDGVNPGPFGYSPDGVLAGGTLGYNLQLDRVVLGIEGDIGYMDVAGSGIIGSTHADHHQDLTLDGGAYGDITGRAGIALGRALVYGKGGLAFYSGEASQATTNPGYAPTGTDTFTGWVAGGGIEYALTESLSIKAEYLHFDFGDQDAYQTSLVADDPTPAGYKFHNTTDLNVDTVKFGINYHF